MTTPGGGVELQPGRGVYAGVMITGTKQVAVAVRVFVAVLVAGGEVRVAVLVGGSAVLVGVLVAGGEVRVAVLV